MVYARASENGPVLEYSGSAAIVPSNYKILDPELAQDLLAEQLAAENATIAKAEAERAMLLDGAFVSLTAGLPLTGAEAMALGARPLATKN